jgi:biopolymer transport protein ExbB/TolQ
MLSNLKKQHPKIYKVVSYLIIPVTIILFILRLFSSGILAKAKKSLEKTQEESDKLDKKINEAKNKANEHHEKAKEHIKEADKNVEDSKNIEDDANWHKKRK